MRSMEMTEGKLEIRARSKILRRLQKQAQHSPCLGREGWFGSSLEVNGFQKGQHMGDHGEAAEIPAAVRSGWRADKFGECNTGPNAGGI